MRVLMSGLTSIMVVLMVSSGTVNPYETQRFAPVVGVGLGTLIKYSVFDTMKSIQNEKIEIKKILSKWIKEINIDVIITTGGTGLTGRDITPEAIKEVGEKEIPGFGELFRELSYKTVGTSAMQSRACAVLANGKYIFALPGSSGGVTDAWDRILKYQLDINNKPCNFVELFPRLKEK